MRILVSEKNKGADIISFPSDRIVNTRIEPDTRKEDAKKAKEQYERNTKKFIETLCEEMSIMIIQKLVDQAVDTTKKHFIKDVSLVIDSIKSLLHRDFDLKHPLHKVVDRAVTYKIQNGIRMIDVDYERILKDYKQGEGKSSIEDVLDHIDDPYGGIDFEPDDTPGK